MGEILEIHGFKRFSLNAGGRLIEFDRPAVMGILNVTPDSFYAASRSASDQEIERRVAEMLDDGVDIIDIGGYSSRPGADDVEPGEESRRILKGIEAVRRQSCDVLISIDTFRSDVASAGIEAGADIVNDISGGDLDERMFDTVASMGVPYILMHMRGTPSTMAGLTQYGDVTADVISELSSKVARLSLLGVSDVIIDPGFGFSKSLDQNYEMLRELPAFGCFDRPLLVGVSRKSMIYKLLGGSAAEALNGTTAVNMLSLVGGASILRVHDVKAAAETVKIYMKTITAGK